MMVTLQVLTLCVRVDGMIDFGLVLLQMGIVGSERVFKVLDTNSRIVDGGTYNLSNIKQSLVLKFSCSDLFFSMSCVIR